MALGHIIFGLDYAYQHCLFICYLYLRQISLCLITQSMLLPVCVCWWVLFTSPTVYISGVT